MPRCQDGPHGRDRDRERPTEASTPPSGWPSAAALLGRRPGPLGDDQAGHGELTVRAICRQAGLTARYFYESFTDKDEFVERGVRWVVAGLAATTQAAVAAAPATERARAAMANIVRTIDGRCPRIGRLLFSTQLADP